MDWLLSDLDPRFERAKSYACMVYDNPLEVHISGIMSKNLSVLSLTKYCRGFGRNLLVVSNADVRKCWI